jgi:hypothetical protein
MRTRRPSRVWLFAAIAAFAASGVAQGGQVEALRSWLDAGTAPIPGPAIGPFNTVFLAGGIGLDRAIEPAADILRPGATWTLTAWLRIDSPSKAAVTVVEIGAPSRDSPCRCLMLDDGRPAIPTAQGELAAPRPLPPGEWHAVAVVYDGAALHLDVDGAEIGQTPAKLGTADPAIHLAPTTIDDPTGPHFGGAVAALQFRPGAFSAPELDQFWRTRPDFGLLSFTHQGAGWPLQVTAWRGLQTPQDAWTLPHAHTPPDRPVAVPPPSGPALRPLPDRAWALGQWRLSEAGRVTASGADISRVPFDDRSWLAATVPGTVLTTLIDRGIYPDPDIGLNNLAIPSTLARQSYWYRTTFEAPAEWSGQHLSLTFKGINYAAEIWLNGQRIGVMRGAFARGRFDVSDRLRPGETNILAVRIDPPPHPGIAHEESVAAGPGENGGRLALDGPTFTATEGWDWIPGIRDRDTGLWQDVVIEAKGLVRLLDPNIVTRLDLPRTDTAEIEIQAPVENDSGEPRDALVSAQIGGILVERRLRLPPGETLVQFNPKTDPALKVEKPRLWWPNGYGPANLYDLALSVRIGDAVSDTRHLRFGIRHLTYELSLFDHAGALRRVEIDPAAAGGQSLVDTRHAAIKRTPNGWAYSLTAAGEASPAVHPVATPHGEAPYLTLKVNGVPIAARGGSWGMDDSRKRVSRARLEPYFRLHRDANINIIRNWMGQDTEDVFYDLADEYGLLVLNDFWESTEDFQLEPQDPQLFLANAQDVIRRYRWHPSIVAWFGRNEGVPQPILNEGLAGLVQALDGTRYYSPSSNRIGLADSGPYDYRAPDAYFTSLGRGFAVEIGTPSPATLEAIEAMIPPADRWPLSDTFAYHDWHVGGNGDVATFMATLERRFGPATDLRDFDRKAQMLAYESYRAIFEGMAAGLWTHNSARLLWMTHPAWPSNHWQIYSADTDTAAAYFGTKKALEPVHAQLDLPDYQLAVVNTTLSPRPGLKLHSAIVGLDGAILATRDDTVDAAANATTTLPPIALRQALFERGIALVALTLEDGGGTIVSRNLYWRGATDSDSRALVEMPRQSLTASASQRPDGGEAVVTVKLANPGAVPALAAKLTLLDDHGQRILPAYYDDNYVSLLPGESREIAIRFAADRRGASRLALRGWNVTAAEISVAAR